MKLRPVLIVASVFVTMAIFSSCTREYICQCEISYTGKPGLPDTTINQYKIEDTKKNAESLCEQNSSNTTENGITAVEDCYLF